MFTTYEKSRIPLQFNDGSAMWSYVELSIYAPWFKCEIEQFSEEGSLTTMIFLLRPDQIKNLKSQLDTKIKAVYLCSPSYINLSEGWQIHKLSKIQLCTFDHNENELPVFKFITTEGQALYHNVTGIAEQEKNLEYADYLCF